jgi:hypothetical protein
MSKTKQADPAIAGLLGLAALLHGASRAYTNLQNPPEGESPVGAAAKHGLGTMAGHLAGGGLAALAAGNPLLGIPAALLGGTFAGEQMNDAVSPAIPAIKGLWNKDKTAAMAVMQKIADLTIKPTSTGQRFCIACREKHAPGTHTKYKKKETSTEPKEEKMAEFSGLDEPSSDYGQIIGKPKKQPFVSAKGGEGEDDIDDPASLGGSHGDHEKKEEKSHGKDSKHEAKESKEKEHEEHEEHEKESAETCGTFKTDFTNKYRNANFAGKLDLFRQAASRLGKCVGR